LGKWWCALLGAVSALPVFALVLFLLPTRTDLVISMLEVRRPALIERVTTLLLIRAPLEELKPASSDVSGNFGVPAGVGGARVAVMLPDDLPLTKLEALRPQIAYPTDHDLWLVETDCRELQGFTYLPDGLINSQDVKSEFCEAAQLAAIDPQELEFISADSATNAVNALLDFEYLAIFRLISLTNPRAATTQAEPGYLIAEVILFEMNNADPIARFVFETTNDEAALAVDDQSALFDNLGETGKKVMQRHFRGGDSDEGDPFDPARLDEARARAESLSN